MIRVVDTVEPSQATVTLGDYLCLNLAWPVVPLRAPAYWRPGDHQRSLMEVGVHPDTGVLVSISTVLPGDQVEIRAQPAPPSGRPARPGHPVMDLGPWNGKPRYDEVVPFRIVVHADAATVWFASADQADTDLVSDRTRFHLSASGELVGFSLEGMTGAEVGRLADSLAWLMANAGIPMQSS